MLTAFLHGPWEQATGRQTLTFQSNDLNATIFTMLHEKGLATLIDHGYFLVCGKIVQPFDRLIQNDDLKCDQQLVDVFFSLRLAGGKGGYGSLLRAQGNKMSSQKSSNLESCRNLEGRRLRTIHQSEAIAEHLRQRPQIQREKKQKMLKKIENILSQKDDAAAVLSHASISRETQAVSDRITQTIQTSVQSLRDNSCGPSSSREIKNSKSTDSCCNSGSRWEKEAYD